MKKILLLLFSFFTFCASAQVVYEDINNIGIYEFLDELANLKVIEINSVVKPYSRQFIAEKLLEAKGYVEGQKNGNTEIRNGAKRSSAESNTKYVKKKYLLNKRQVKELEFYLQDYQIDLRCAIRDTGYTMRDARIEGNEQLVKDPGSRIPDPGSDCYLDYDHKLGFLFKNKPSFAVPLNPLAFQYKDRLFTLSVRPILGISYMTNENGSALHKYWGGSMFGYIGKNFGFYANLRDNNESVGLEYPEYFTLRGGHVYKGNPNGGVDYFEMKGGVTVSWNWGSVGLLNDRFTWGNNYHGANILSEKAPPYPYLYLHLKPVKWLEFSYMHGWLNSNVIDSSRSYYSGDVYRVVYRNKYIAANMFTVTPWKRLNISFGNSIIYSDINVNPLYLIPFMFFNAVDATKNSYNNNGGSNSQLFFDISSRQIRHLHLYVTLFIDELKMSRVTDPDLQNFTSWKAGFKVSDFPLSNLSFTFEWTKTNPMTYKHYISTTSFASNNYNMGNYLRDNSREYYFALAYKPIRGLFVQASYTLAAHGDDYPYDYSSPIPVDQVPFIKNKTWQNSEVAVSARYEYTANGYFFLEYLNSSRMGDVRYQPGFMHGKTNTIVAGVNVGF
ncbi:MAG: hypothetical protein IH596_02815 [Bacteroidales bacterium]|nr:hypothetical protein [Bacteroidales bacterium]